MRHAGYPVLAGLALLIAPCAHASDLDRHAHGAHLPYVEMEAEDAATNGVVLGPDRTLSTLAAEASGRQAVRLIQPGQYVEFTLTQPANAVDIRYSVPDTQDGKGLDATLSLYVDGVKRKSLPMTSRYGWFYGAYPFTNTPADGGHPFHFYDDVRVLLGEQLAAGARVRLQVDPGDTAPSYTIDLADFEDVPAPLPKPALSLSVTDFGADPTGVKDSGDAFDRAIAEARKRGQGVWIPAGTFTVNRHVAVDRISLQGAGPWYSVVHGNGVGFFGHDSRGPDGPSRHVHLRDFAIFGEVTDRDDGASLAGIGGGLDSSEISNVWIEHTKVGVWVDGPFKGLRIRHCRFKNLTADGVNFHRGVTHSSVTQSIIRNTGDDGLAMWSEDIPDAHDGFADNTVALPMLANGIAIYGGRDISVIGNRVSDSLWQGGGIQIANRFHARPLGGAITLEHNVIDRAGAREVNWNIDIGALWVFAGDAPIDAKIRVSDTDIRDSTFAGVQVSGGDDKTVAHIAFDHVSIEKTGTYGLVAQTNSQASARALMISQTGKAPVYSCGVHFMLEDLDGRTASPQTACDSER